MQTVSVFTIIATVATTAIALPIAQSNQNHIPVDKLHDKSQSLPAINKLQAPSGTAAVASIDERDFFGGNEDLELEGSFLSGMSLGEK